MLLRNGGEQIFRKYYNRVIRNLADNRSRARGTQLILAVSKLRNVRNSWNVFLKSDPRVARCHSRIHLFYCRWTPPRFYTWCHSGRGISSPRYRCEVCLTGPAIVEALQWKHYVGLDVSLKLTAICVVDRTGKIKREGVVPSDPEAIATFIKSHAPHSQDPLRTSGRFIILAGDEQHLDLFSRCRPADAGSGYFLHGISNESARTHPGQPDWHRLSMV